MRRCRESPRQNWAVLQQSALEPMLSLPGRSAGDAVFNMSQGSDEWYTARVSLLLSLQEMMIPAISLSPRDMQDPYRDHSVIVIQC